MGVVNQRPLINELQQGIQEVLCYHDPITLVKRGAPKDEYSPESQTIAQAVAPGMTIQEVTEITHAEFRKWFDHKIAGGVEKYEDIARDIVKLLDKNQDPQ